MININNAKILFIASIITMIFSICAASAAPSISVEPGTNVVNPGDDFIVNITVDPDGSSIHAGAFTLLFNQSILQVNEIISPEGEWGFTPGTFLSQDGKDTIIFFNTSNNTKGTAQYGEFRNASTGVTSSGIMASISLHVKDSATEGMSSILNLSDVQFATPSPSMIDVIVNNGSANIETENAVFTLPLKIGWNMVSLPIIPDDPSVSAIFGSNVTTVYGWTGTTYELRNELEPKQGYWALSSSNYDITVTGTPVVDRTRTLTIGWNMVGPVTNGIMVSSLPNVTTVYEWTGTSYNIVSGSNTLTLTKGYWMLANAISNIQI